MNNRLDEINTNEILDESTDLSGTSQVPVLLAMTLGTAASTAIAYFLTGNLDVALFSAYVCFAITAWHAGRHAAKNRKELIIALIRLQLPQIPELNRRRAIAERLDSIVPIHRREFEVETKLFPAVLAALAVLQGIILLDSPANAMLRAASAISMLIVYVLAFRIGRERIRFQKRVRQMRRFKGASVAA